MSETYLLYDEKTETFVDKIISILLPTTILYIKNIQVNDYGHLTFSVTQSMVAAQTVVDAFQKASEDDILRAVKSHYPDFAVKVVRIRQTVITRIQEVA